jgi:hypothetical protein
MPRAGTVYRQAAAGSANQAGDPREATPPPRDPLVQFNEHFGRLRTRMCHRGKFCSGWRPDADRLHDIAAKPAERGDPRFRGRISPNTSGRLVNVPASAAWARGPGTLRPQSIPTNAAPAAWPMADRMPFHGPAGSASPSHFPPVPGARRSRAARWVLPGNRLGATFQLDPNRSAVQEAKNKARRQSDRVNRSSL